MLNRLTNVANSHASITQALDYNDKKYVFPGRGITCDLVGIEREKGINNNFVITREENNRLKNASNYIYQDGEICTLTGAALDAAISTKEVIPKNNAIAAITVTTTSKKTKRQHTDAETVTSATIAAPSNKTHAKTKRPKIQCKLDRYGIVAVEETSRSVSHTSSLPTPPMQSPSPHGVFGMFSPVNAQLQIHNRSSATYSNHSPHLINRFYT